MSRIDCTRVIRRMEEELSGTYQIELHQATTVQLHNALANAVMMEIAPAWRESRRAHESVRRAYYLSAEYLMGRMVFSNLYNLGILDEMSALLRERGADIRNMEEIDDAALGNGGLGRLAACYLDSAATHDLPLDGYGIRYKCGLFRQVFEDGFQVEKADEWQRFGDPWSKRRDDKTVEVVFADQRVLAVPYDMPVMGYGTGNMGTLRLWQSEPVEELDFRLFNEQEYDLAVRDKNAAEDITRVLYPNDSTPAGKRLRLKQQYFLSSASLQDAIRRYRRVRGNDLMGFAAHCAIQINDTHPTVAIPELVRLLMREGMEFDAALNIARNTFNFTNHTIMAEALERWDMELLRSVVPEIADIVLRINDALNEELRALGVADARKCRMQIVCDNAVHMARLAIYVSSYVNGVAKIHTDILKHDVFADWYAVYPQRFQNKTNGITQRRFLGLCNPELTGLIAERIGNGFLTDLNEIGSLREQIDEDLVERFVDVKRQKKRQLAATVLKNEGVSLPADFLYDVQVKRMHEYKRQFMNALSIMDIYDSIKDGTLKDFTPTVFLFGAKAAPGYMRAKCIIKYINEVARLVNSDPAMKDLMRVVFVQNYNCSYAEHIIPAADISEQISPAGTEASGTGNMKLMLNGAVTLGTYDGANIEIVEQAGLDNNYIFGARVEEISCVRPTYNPKAIYDQDARIRRMLDTLVNGRLSDGGTGSFGEIYNSILFGANWHAPDQYFTLLDLMPYIDAKLRANRDYRDTLAFGRKCLVNIASAGMFSSDRAVKQYAEEIWHLPRVRLGGR
ncbi:MAG TPA: glycogen/starch/alpha-glucan phosphorylase [Clostridia bacterium]|nr:glycogen/starch/alpha-glucan phosphorylase [Clostridia bacterium]